MISVQCQSTEEEEQRLTTQNWRKLCKLFSHFVTTGGTWEGSGRVVSQRKECENLPKCFTAKRRNETWQESVPQGQTRTSPNCCTQTMWQKHVLPQSTTADPRLVACKCRAATLWQGPQHLQLTDDIRYFHTSGCRSVAYYLNKDDKTISNKNELLRYIYSK